MSILLQPYTWTMGEAARRWAVEYPQRVACQDEQHAITYAELDEQANRLANALIDHGFRKGDHAALLMGLHPQGLVAAVAIARAGGVIEFLIHHYSAELPRMVAPLPPRWLLYSSVHQSIADHIVAAHQPRTVALQDDAPAELHWSALLAQGDASPPDVTVTPDDDCMVVFTSGTTATPKTVLRTHNSAMTQGLLINHYTHLDEQAVMAYMLLRYDDPAMLLTSGARMVIVPSLQPRPWLEAIQRERISHLGAVSTVVQHWLSFPEWEEYDTSSVRSVFAGASRPSDTLHRLAAEKLGFPIIQLYGSQDAGMLAVNDPAWGLPRDAIGYPVDGKAFRVIDENGEPLPPGEVGELVVRPAGPNRLGMLRSYGPGFPDPWADGWLHTGDLVHADADGVYFLHGRIFETINVAGFKVYAPEVEAVLAAHPAIAEVAVVGQPDKLRGEVVVAHVVLQPGQPASIGDLRAYCASRLAEHKIPKRILIDETLPKTVTGKVNKQVLKAAHSEG